MDAADARGRLREEPFAFVATKEGAVRISCRGRNVVVVAGEPGRRLAARLAGADPGERQQLLARATGNFRRGNERAGRARGAQ
jgi:hypothetical protein